MSTLMVSARHKAAIEEFAFRCRRHGLPVTEQQVLDATLDELLPSTPEELKAQSKARREALQEAKTRLVPRPDSLEERLHGNYFHDAELVEKAFQLGHRSGWRLFQVRKASSRFLFKREW